ncbi:MAG: DNA alkylation repair protein [Halanaerobiales bacterium]|nr:DNA alkylation repair protein [Halanaerobiales bacterium]
MDTINLIKCLKEDISKIETTHIAAELSKIANKYYKEVPESDEKLLEVCEQLIASNKMSLFSIATLWIKKRKTTIDMKYFSTIENWLYKYIHHWGTCDQFCYRVLNPFVDKYPELFENVLVWADSDQTYVRRAAPVSMIRIGKGFRVKSDIDKVIVIVEKLKDDNHLHIQKGIGCLLKYSYHAYPDEVLNYLRNNVNNLSRTTFRYALEKVPKEIKQEMMKL